MPSPDWRRVVAMDDSTEVRMLRHVNGSVSIKLSAGPLSIVAVVDEAGLGFLLRHEEAANATG